jgi:plastocyanin
MRGISIVFSLLSTASIAGCSGGGGDGLEPIDPGTGANQISIIVGAQNRGSAAFTPNPLSISLADGAVVRWVNNDIARDDGYGGTVGGATHNITSDDGSFPAGSLTPGNAFEATFGAPGTYGYHCDIHPTMTGEVTVTP